MQHDTIKQTRERLKEWGDYMNRSDGSGGAKGYPSQSSLLNINFDGGRAVYQDNPKAWEIEKVVLRLKKNNHQWYSALLCCYFYNVPSVDGCKWLNVSLATYKVILNKAEAWVDAWLDALSDKAA